jgi:hypothetical protein
MTHNTDPLADLLRAAGPRETAPAERARRVEAAVRLEWQDVVQTRLGRKRAAWIAASCLTSAALIALVLHAHAGQVPTQAAAQRPLALCQPARDADRGVRGPWLVLPREQRGSAAGPRHAASHAGDLRGTHEMISPEHDLMILSRLVGGWQGTLQHRAAPEEPFRQLPGTSENRWVLGGRFVEMTLRAGVGGDNWSAVLYIGYERSERRYVLVSLEPGDRRVTTRLGQWRPELDRLVLTSDQSSVVCDMTTPGQLTLELSEEAVPGHEFVRFRAEYRWRRRPCS